MFELATGTLEATTVKQIKLIVTAPGYGAPILHLDLQCFPDAQRANESVLRGTGTISNPSIDHFKTILIREIVGTMIPLETGITPPLSRVQLTGLDHFLAGFTLNGKLTGVGWYELGEQYYSPVHAKKS